MSKITNDGLTRSGTGRHCRQLYPYDNSGRQRVRTYVYKNYVTSILLQIISALCIAVNVKDFCSLFHKMKWLVIYRLV